MHFGFRELLFVLLLLGVPVAMYFFVFEPRNKQVAEVRAEIRQKQAKLDELQQATKRIPDLGKEIDRLHEAIDVIEQKLPDERKVDEVLKQVWELATRQRLTPKSVRTEKPLPTLNFSELPITMEIVGNFDGFYSFLLELEKMPRITQLPKMKLSKVTVKDSSEGVMKADLVLSVFFEADDSQMFNSGPANRGRSRL